MFGHTLCTDSEKESRLHPYAPQLVSLLVPTAGVPAIHNRDIDPDVCPYLLLRDVSEEEPLTCYSDEINQWVFVGVLTSILGKQKPLLEGLPKML